MPNLARVEQDSDLTVPSLVTRLPRWPSANPVSLNAWTCECGAYGTGDSQPQSRRELEQHLANAEHRRGEYYYGCQRQRATVAVLADPGGRFTHQLVTER